MSRYDTKPFFVRALKKELGRLGHGGQAQVARASGVSKTLLSDIINGRTFGAEEKRRAIAAALGYEDYEAFLDIGRKLMKVPTVRQPLKRERKAASSGELIELLRENRELRIDLDQARKQIEHLRNQIEGIGHTCDPSVLETRSARDAAPSGKLFNE